MSTDNMTLKVNFDADDAINGLTEAVAALADMSAPNIRLECLKLASSRFKLIPGCDEPVSVIVWAAGMMADFVIKGTKPPEPGRND